MSYNTWQGQFFFCSFQGAFDRNFGLGKAGERIGVRESERDAPAMKNGYIGSTGELGGLVMTDVMSKGRKGCSLPMRPPNFLPRRPGIVLFC